MKGLRALLFCLACLLAQARGLGQSEDLVAKSQRAKELMASGKFADAIPLYRELNRAVPNNAGLMLNLGMALHMAGEDRKAIPQLEAAVSKIEWTGILCTKSRDLLAAVARPEIYGGEPR